MRSTKSNRRIKKKTKTKNSWATKFLELRLQQQMRRVLNLELLLYLF